MAPRLLPPFAARMGHRRFADVAMPSFSASLGPAEP